MNNITQEQTSTPFYAAAFELQQEKPNSSEIEDLSEKGIKEK
jgi:hypothetical protein